MKPGETDPDLATVEFPIYDTDGLICSGASGEGAVYVPSAGEVQVRINRAAYSNATNALSHTGDGIYALKLAAAEIVSGKTDIRIKKAGTIRTQVITVEVDGAVSSIATIVAAIKAKTDNLPSDPADASDIAASLATIAGYIDTEVASILAATTTISAALVDIGGLLHRNSLLDNITYTGSELSTARLRVFANAAALAAATIAAADNADGEVRRYTLTGTFALGKLASFKARQVL